MILTFIKDEVLCRVKDTSTFQRCNSFTIGTMSKITKNNTIIISKRLAKRILKLRVIKVNKMLKAPRRRITQSQVCKMIFSLKETTGMFKEMLQ